MRMRFICIDLIQINAALHLGTLTYLLAANIAAKFRQLWLIICKYMNIQYVYQMKMYICRYACISIIAYITISIGWNKCCTDGKRPPEAQLV